MLSQSPAWMMSCSNHSNPCPSISKPFLWYTPALAFHTCFSQLDNNITSIFLNHVSQISTKLFQLMAGTEETGPHSSEQLWQSWLAPSMVRSEWFRVCGLFLCLPVLGRLERRLGKQNTTTGKHYWQSDLRPERPCVQQSGSQIQTWTFWGWLCDSEKQPSSGLGKQLKKNGYTSSSLLGLYSFGSIWNGNVPREYKAVLVWRNFIYQHMWKIIIIFI